MLSNLSKKILATIVYYDVMDYPLTVFEIWKYLISDRQKEISDQEENQEKFSLVEIYRELKNDFVREKIEEKKGFYFLKNREILVTERLRKNKISEEKFKKFLRIIKWIRCVPFVRSIAVAGRVASKNAEQKSDLDIFLILKKGRIFTGRFLVTILVHFLGKRRYGKKINNRICFNHFVTEENKIFVRDLYSSQVYISLIPVFGEEFFLKFQKENVWVKKYRPNFEVGENGIKILKDNFFSKTIRIFFEKIISFNWIENKLKKWQIRKIESNPKTKNSGGIIIYNDCELAFWPDFENQGPRIFEKFQENLQKFDC